jgi:peroxiredoxin
MELRSLQLALPKIKSLGANLVAVSPQLVDKSAIVAKDNALKFDILSDAGNRIAGKFGLVHTMPEKYREMGKKFGVDIADYYGNDSGEMPLAATYVVDQSGIIVHAFIDSDYTKRMEPESIVQVLEKMNQPDSGTGA